MSQHRHTPAHSGSVGVSIGEGGVVLLQMLSVRTGHGFLQRGADALLHVCEHLMSNQLHAWSESCV